MVSVKPLGFGTIDDAGYNLQGALDDLDRFEADLECRNTIRRVCEQLAEVRADFAAISGQSTVDDFISRKLARAALLERSQDMMRYALKQTTHSAQRRATADGMNMAAAVIRDLPAANQWRSMDSAPKDGTQIIIAATGGNGHISVKSDEWSQRFQCWRYFEYCTPLAWMPLPPPLGLEKDRP